jgi:acetoacetyl-CoA synthetase
LQFFVFFVYFVVASSSVTPSIGLDRALDQPLWRPSEERIAQANMSAFLRYVADAGPADYAALYRWSVLHPEQFWPRIWSFFDVIADEREGEPWDEVVRGVDRMAPPDPEAGPGWFLGARLNFAENLLRHRDDQDAIVAWNELGRQGVLSYADLYREVARVAAALRAHGIRAGDRVAGYMPNVPETVIAMLATASLGAVWSSCSPDFGVQGVLDRFGQIEPRVLFCTERYRYAGKEIDLRARITEVVTLIPAIGRVVVVPYGGGEPDISGIPRAQLYDDFASSRTDARLPSRDWRSIIRSTFCTHRAPPDCPSA